MLHGLDIDFFDILLTFDSRKTDYACELYFRFKLIVIRSNI